MTATSTSPSVQAAVRALCDRLNLTHAIQNERLLLDALDRLQASDEPLPDYIQEVINNAV